MNQKAKEIVEETFPTSSRTYIEVETSPKREQKTTSSSTFNNTSNTTTATSTNASTSSTSSKPLSIPTSSKTSQQRPKSNTDQSGSSPIISSSVRIDSRNSQRRRLPWRPSAMAKREKEDVRSKSKSVDLSVLINLHHTSCNYCYNTFS